MKTSKIPSREYSKLLDPWLLHHNYGHIHHGGRFIIDHPAIPLIACTRWLLGVNAGAMFAVLARPQIAAQPQRTVVYHLDDAQNGDAHKQAEQAATVGQKIGRTVQLGSARRDELFLLEEDGQS